jgi:hypothetical protein
MKALVLIFALSLSFSARTQWSSDPTVNNPICVAPSSQNLGHVIGDGSGGAFIAWVDLRFGLNWDVFMQRIAANGQVQWETNGIAIRVDTIDQAVPRIVSDGSGGTIVTWLNGRRPGLQQNDVYAQRVDAAGNILWTSGGVLVHSYPTSVGVIGSLLAMSDDLGGAVIVWEQHSGSERDIYAQRVDSSGAVLWEANGVPISVLPGGQFLSQMTTDGAGGAIVAWNDDRNGNTDVYAQRISGQGLIQWQITGRAICTDPSNQGNLSIVSDGMGGAIVVWDDFRNGIVDRDIFAQRVDPNGTPQWDSNGVVVSSVAGSHQFDPKVASDQNGGAIVAWLDFRNFGGEDIYSQRINHDGVAQWTLNGVAISNRSGQETSLQIISDSAGGAIMAWHYFIGGDLYAQRINATGAIQWANNGAAMSTAPSNQLNPQFIADAPGSAIVVWDDARSGNLDIYAQRVDAGGSLGGTTSVGEEPAASVFQLAQNYPNPFNPTTTFSFSLPQSSIVNLTVYDLRGREVATLVNAHMGPGSHSVQFDGTGLASGVYFYRLVASGGSFSRKLLLTR